MEPFTEVALNPENLRQPNAQPAEVEAQIDQLESVVQSLEEAVDADDFVGQTGELRFSILRRSDEVEAILERVAPEYLADGVFSLIDVR